MYAAVTRATRVEGNENMAEEAVMVGETMVTWLRDIEGFEGLLMLTDAETGAVQVIALWESEEVAADHGDARARLRERVSATVDVHLEETVGFDVPYAFFQPPADA